MDIAAGDRVADAEQLVAAVGVSDDLLWLQVQQCLLVDFTEIRRPGEQIEIELGRWQCAVFDDHLVDDALPGGVRALVVQVDPEASALASDRGRSLVERHAHVVLGEDLEVAGIVHPADVGSQSSLRCEEFDRDAAAG